MKLLKHSLNLSAAFFAMNILLAPLAFAKPQTVS